MKKFRDLTGLKFGSLTVVRFSHKNDYNALCWLCKCDCNTEKIIVGSSLVGGSTKTCGCKINNRTALKDISGQKFGRLTVVSFYEIKQNDGHAYWNCKCDCGKEVIVSGRSLRDGGTQSCGCLRNGQNVKNILGKRFGRLTVVSFFKIIKNQAYWTCLCDCGKTKNIKSANLSIGSTSSCGCLIKDVISDIHFKHGESGKSKTVEYETWKSIKARCYNIKNEHYIDYGGRGITMCDEWINSFDVFLADMGRRPSPKHSIDRIENDKGYYKENCRWATRKEQSNNRRNNVFLTFNNQTLSINEWAKKTNIKRMTISARIKHGWTLEKALTTPLKK